MGENSSRQSGSFKARLSANLSKSIGVSALALIWFSPGSDAHAESLRAAMAKAYLNNPQLGADRARQRATDEKVPQARSGWRPTVEANADYGVTWSKTRTRVSNAFTGRTSTIKSTDERGTGGFSITMNQPVFDGFKTINSVRQAESTVDAGRQALLAVEQTVLLEAVTAYMNVFRDRNIVLLRLKNVEALKEQVRASRARFDVGEITRTDVAQSEARLAEAERALAVSRANRAGSEALYTRVIGARPRKLSLPRRKLKLPCTLQSSLAIADATNPTVLAAAHQEQASRFSVDVENGNLLPQFNIQANYGVRYKPATQVRSQKTSSLVGVLRIPLYQGGGVYSRIREAKHTNNQRRMEILDARRIVRQNVITSWNNIRAADETHAAARQQVKASELAYSGVKQENLVGSRTTLDVLNAESELLNSKVSVVLAQREQVVSRYQLMASVGKLTSAFLNLGVSRYDPLVNYQRVKDKLFGADINESD